MSLYHSNSSYITIVDTDKRLSGTATQFSYNLNLPKPNNFNRICLKSISIPRSFYDFSTGYNTFSLLESGFSPVTITITPGYYNKNSLITVLQTLLTNASPHNWIYTVSYPYYLSANPNTLTYSVSGNSSQPAFIFTTNCYLQLVFNSNTVNYFTSNSLTSPNSIAITSINQLFLKSSVCVSSLNSILCEIFIAGKFSNGTYIYYEPNDIDINSKEFINNNNNVFDFLLTDKNGNTVNLQVLGFIFSLICYTKDVTPELQKDYLQIKNAEKL